MKYLVLLDGGHGLNTIGKETDLIPSLGRRIKENEFNDAVVEVMIDLLESVPNLHVFDVAPGRSDIPLKTRTDTANKIFKDFKSKYGSNNVKAVYISVHYDAHTGKFSTSKGEGHSVFIYKGQTNKDAGRLAKSVLNELVKGTKQKNRGIKEADFHVLRETHMPAILTENGFMDNLREAMLMIDPSFVQECAREHVNGILNYFGIKGSVVDLNTFKDVSDKHTAYKSIEALAKLGVLNGYPDGTFKPNQNVTRGELAIIVSRILNVK